MRSGGISRDHRRWGYFNGNYAEEPPTFKYIVTFFSLATPGGTQSFLRRAPTRALTDKLVAAAPWFGQRREPLSKGGNSPHPPLARASG
jgi:hypothetical protein